MCPVRNVTYVSGRSPYFRIDNIGYTVSPVWALLASAYLTYRRRKTAALA